MCIYIYNYIHIHTYVVLLVSLILPPPLPTYYSKISCVVASITVLLSHGPPSPITLSGHYHYPGFTYIHPSHTIPYPYIPSHIHPTPLQPQTYDLPTNMSHWYSHNTISNITSTNSNSSNSIYIHITYILYTYIYTYTVTLWAITTTHSHHTPPPPLLPLHHYYYY